MTQDILRYKSFAKINLSLEIRKKRPDGFHNLKSIFQSIDLFDEMSFSMSRNDILLNVESPYDDHGLYTDNIVYRTAQYLKEEWNVKEGVAISLKKRIPTGAGLGGGSSNAAVTIMALDRLWGLGMPGEEILRISAVMGSDVPFFYYGGRVLVQGRGELLTPLEDIEPVAVILVKPHFSISSSDAYRWWDEMVEKEGNLHSDVVVSGAVKNLLYNDFEKIVFPKYPLLQTIKERLLEFGCSGALLSGSGSCMYGIVEDMRCAPHIAEKMRFCSTGSVILARTLRREESCMM